jgi:hypothetical protein
MSRNVFSGKPGVLFRVEPVVAVQMAAKSYVRHEFQHLLGSCYG